MNEDDIMEIRYALMSAAIWTSGIPDMTFVEKISKELEKISAIIDKYDGKKRETV